MHIFLIYLVYLFFWWSIVTLWQPPPQGKLCHNYLVLLQKVCPKNARNFWFGKNIITFQLHQKVYCHFAIICRKHWIIILKNFSMNDLLYIEPNWHIIPMYHSSEVIMAFTHSQKKKIIILL